MAVFKNGILGSYRNGIGNIVTYRSGGQDIARTKPASFKDANTETQQVQRSVFKQALELYRVCSTTVKITNPERGAKYSPYNVFMKENTNKSISSQGTNLADLVLSKGSLKEVIPGAISGAGENNVDITWPDNTNNTTAFANDRAVVTLIREDTHEVITEVSQVQRSAGAIGVALPESWDDTNIFAYVSFVSADMKKASANSRRFDLGQVAIWLAQFSKFCCIVEVLFLSCVFFAHRIFHCFEPGFKINPSHENTIL